MLLSRMYFDFGENWGDYSEDVLTSEKLEQARSSLKRLFGDNGLMGRKILDVGSGSGIFSIAALQLGAKRVVGIDINQKCIHVGQNNAIKFLGKDKEISPEFYTISVLDETSMSKLGVFDIVYAWGSLHHTGEMNNAIANVLKNVEKGGTLCLAIYNKHFTSPIWRIIKSLYILSPNWLKKVWICGFYPIIYIAKYLTTFENPLKKQRGMSFYYDVVDWIGGYPYEYACEKEILDFVVPKGFKHVKTFHADLPIGNNEFIFEKV